MLIRNKVFFIIFFILNLCFFNLNLYADEFDISAVEITVDKKNNIIIGKGSVEAKDSDGKVITADEIIYEKSIELLRASGSVVIKDIEGNILTTDKAIFDKIEGMINSYNNSELKTKEGYRLVSNVIYYDTEKKIISSNQKSTMTDTDGNLVTVTMFQYFIEKNLFSSVGDIRVVDANKNKYFFKELHVDTKKKQMIGSDVSVLFNQENFGVSKESDPRMVANDILVTKNKSILSKGVFTVCQKKGDKCPPWLLKAKKIRHDKAKKTIYYDHAVLKIYDIPLFYFPRFFHPDPTIKRKSGLLSPFFTNSNSLGTGFGLPYFWAISDDKDLTFTPKIYSGENILLLNEFRQAYRNGFLTLDTSYTEGYKETSSTKTDGSRNHIFAQLDFDLSNDKPYESNLSLKVQRTSNDTYFRIHDINTALVNSENTNLENKINYNFSKGDTSLDISAIVYENLREKTNKRYEYTLPNIMYGKSFFSEKFGAIDFQSNALYKNYEVNKHRTALTNDIVWTPNSTITKGGFVNTLQGMIRNTNYEAKNTTEYKTAGAVNELASVLSFKSSLPMKKEAINYSNFFSPNFMVRFAPTHMRNLGGQNIKLNYANLYSMNKTAEIESGLSAILGFDYKINKKDAKGNENEKLSVSLGQVFNKEENRDLPSKSSLDQKTSDVVGEINYNFSKIGGINYKFSLDHNINNLNYNEVSTNLNFGRLSFNLDYLEERRHVGSEHYINNGITLNFNDNNKLSFETKKNYKTSSTEFYDISYQYMIDCLTAGLVYRREYYEDSATDVQQKESLMFKITFVPFGAVKTPALNP